MDMSGQESKLLPQGARLPVISSFGKKQTNEQNTSARARLEGHATQGERACILLSSLSLAALQSHTILASQYNYRKEESGKKNRMHGTFLPIPFPC